MSLAALPLLLTDANFRRRVVPLAVIRLAWVRSGASFEAWSEQERTTAIAPTLNKLRPLLMRPELRAIVGQVKPAFRPAPGLHRAQDSAGQSGTGQLGPETAALLGSLIMSQLWQAILGRSAIPPERRHPVLIVRR